MPCRGVCRRPEYAFRPTFRVRGRQSLYACGAKMCIPCAAWLEWDGRLCPCCSKQLRTRPRNARFKRKWMEKVLVAATVQAGGAPAKREGRD